MTDYRHGTNPALIAIIVLGILLFLLGELKIYQRCTGKRGRKAKKSGARRKDGWLRKREQIENEDLVVLSIHGWNMQQLEYAEMEF